MSEPIQPLTELRRCTNALGQVLAIASMPKKTEQALLRIWHKQTEALAALLPPPAEAP